MIKLFFVTVLVVTTRTIPEGWIQWTQSYNNHEICMESLAGSYDQITLSVKNYLGKELIEVREMRCLTYDQAVKLNSELGH